MALKMAGITRNTQNPTGGVIQKDANGELNGVFEECGGLVARLIPAPDAAGRLEAIRISNAHYLTKGVTTAVIAGMDLPKSRGFSAGTPSGCLGSAVENHPRGKPIDSDSGARRIGNGEVGSGRIDSGLHRVFVGSAILFSGWDSGTTAAFHGVRATN